MSAWTKSRFAALGVAITMVAALGATAKTAQAQVIKLGGLVTTSGVNAFVGVAAAKGMEVAVATVNAEPAKYLGSAKRSLKADIRDAGENASQAVALGRAMADDSSFVALIGPSTSPQALALGPLAQSFKIPLIVPHSPAPGITAAGDEVFRVAATNDQLGAQVIQAVVKRKGLKKVGVIYSPDNNANLLAGQSVEKALADLGIAAVSFTIPHAEQDYGGAVSKMRDAKVDGVFIATHSGGVASAMIQAQRTGYKAQWMGGPMFANKVVFGNAGKAAVGAILATDYNPSLATALNQKFRADFEKAAGTSADPFSAQAFSAVLAVAAAVKSIPEGREVTRDALKGALAKLQKIEVVVGDGTMAFAPDRSARLTAALLTIADDGTFKPID